MSSASTSLTREWEERQEVENIRQSLRSMGLFLSSFGARPSARARACWLPGQLPAPPVADQAVSARLADMESRLGVLDRKLRFVRWIGGGGRRASGPSISGTLLGSHGAERRVRQGGRAEDGS